MMVPIACPQCSHYRMEYKPHNVLVPGTGIGKVPARSKRAHAVTCPKCEASYRIYMPPVLFVRVPKGLDLAFADGEDWPG